MLLEEHFGVGGPLYGLRQAVQAHAAAAGLSGSRLLDLVIAAHELAANAVRHGAGRGRLLLSRQNGALHCRVEDAGPGCALSRRRGTA